MYYSYLCWHKLTCDHSLAQSLEWDANIFVYKIKSIMNHHSINIRFYNFI